jgi:hypothetical protein
MNVSPRGLRAFRKRPASPRQRMDMVVLAHIKEQSRLSLGSYGRPRMTEELKEVGVEVGHRRVGRLSPKDFWLMFTLPGVTMSQKSSVPSNRQFGPTGADAGQGLMRPHAKPQISQ